jgi:hypothetical protein
VVLLVMVLFLALLAVAVAAEAELTMSVLAVSAARADLARAQLAAEAAVRVAGFSWRADAGRGLPLLGERQVGTVPDLDGRAAGWASVRRLGGDAYLLLGEGRAGTARARAAALVRVLSVRSFLPPFPAALTGASVRLGENEGAEVMPVTAPPPPWAAAACDPGAADTLAAVFGPGPRQEIASEPSGPAPEGLGPLSWDRLADWADRVETGSVRPGPTVRDGACERAAAGNWGAPEAPASPCAGYFPLVYAPGDLRVEGGAGQGVLVVRGDLTLAEGARFYGPVLVGGTVRAEQGTAIWGAVHARSAKWDGAVHYCACALLRGLSSAPALARPLRLGSRLWLPLPWP